MRPHKELLMMRFWQIIKKLTRRETGISLIETVIAVVILGAVSVSFLNGLTTASRTTFITDEHSTAENIARTQLEWAKQVGYSDNATAYAPAPMPAGKDYTNYSAVITTEALNNPDDGIQKITVNVQRSGKDIFTLKGYKVDR